MLAGYAEGRYNGVRRLPPKVESHRSYGRLVLEVGVPRWVSKVGQHTRLKIRFWGEDFPLVVAIPHQQSTVCEYDVVVQINRLIAYLSDMKILKVEFEDARNGKV